MTRNLAELSPSQALTLFEALKTIKDVTHGLMGHSAFQSENTGLLNAAGETLDDIAVVVGKLSDQLVGQARRMRCRSEEDRRRRIELLLQSEITVGECSLDEAEEAFRLIDSERDEEAA